ncbi:MAG: transglutaminase domain-containing protein, partial [Bacteroidaceae bacterium]|nr:transglutaminase domain-containing protein [Bacteroidaceae bacterium]
MKKTLKKTLLLLIMMLVVCPVAVEAQSKKIKFGQVTAEDFAVKPLAKDSDAVAIYLHEADEYHFMITASLVINHTRDVRLLVLKDEGKEFANFEIPADARALKACAINMVNGKPVRTDIKKENISVEEISKGSKSVKVKKFAVPEVRVGTIIDVHYVEDCGWVDEINFQRSIPIKYRFVDYSLPEIIQSTMNTRGYMIARPTIKECDIVLGSNSYYGKQYLFEFNDVPALKKDKYVKCIDDYRSGIELQFEGINIPGIVWTDSDFETWAEVFKVLADDEDFGKQIINKNPLSEETKSVVNSDRSDADKILALARLVQEKIKWNDYISIYPSKGIRKALKEGKGNSADMNFLLYEMLKDAGYEANLVLLCPRSRGHLPYGRPFWKRLFMAIVQVVTKSGETFYIDASDKYGWANVLDANFMASRALIYDPNAANAK